MGYKILHSGVSEKQILRTINGVLMKFPSNDEMQLFYDMTTFLLSTVGNVPDIYECEDNALLVKDLGDTTFCKLIWEGRKHTMIKETYMKCINWIKSLQQTKLIGLVDREKYFIYVQNLLDLLNGEWIGFRDIFMKIFNANFVNVHYDFQTGNIMCFEGLVFIIDYQDLCSGPQYYDLASLLFDCKVYLSDSQRNELLSYLGLDIDWGVFYLTAVLRLHRSLCWRIKKLTKEYNKELVLDVKRAIRSLKLIDHKIRIDYIGYLVQLLEEFVDGFDNNELRVCVLAAGKGTRMESDLPKTCMTILGKPMIKYILDATQMLGMKDYIVVGYKKDFVIEMLNDYNVCFVEQVKQLGTGHALAQCMNYVDDIQNIVVIMGDMPTINYCILQRMIDFHYETEAISTMLSMRVDGGKNAIITRCNGLFDAIVEYKDIKDQCANEINVGVYVFKVAELKMYLDKLDNKNAQGEYYLTDVLNLQSCDGLKVSVLLVEDLIYPHSANDRNELQLIEQHFSLR